MKTAQIDSYGANDAIIINQDAPKPQTKAGQILVAVKSASINPIDVALRTGYLKDMLPLPFPISLGGDFAGLVEEVGADVNNFKVGDAVYGQAGGLKGGSGSFAEFTVAQVTNAALKPSSLDFEQAASLPLAGSSALQAILEHIKLQAGQKILIQGGAGGIGSIAIQIAKMQGAFVATTVNPDDTEFVKKLGADMIIDYTSQDFGRMLQDYDAVLDTVGGEVTSKSLAILKSGGTLVSMAGKIDPELAKKHGVTAISQMTAASSDQLAKLAKFADDGKITPQIDAVYNLDQVREAFRYFEEASPNGKVVIKIK